MCEKLLHAAEIRGWALKMAYLRPEVPFLLKFKGLAIGEKHAGKIPSQKVGVGPHLRQIPSQGNRASQDQWVEFPASL